MPITDPSSPQFDGVLREYWRVLIAANDGRRRYVRDGTAVRLAKGEQVVMKREDEDRPCHYSRRISETFLALG